MATALRAPDPAAAPTPQALLDGVTAKLAATAADYDARAEFPAENFRILHEAGLLGLTVPQAFGGRGAGLGEAVRVLRAVASGEPSTALILFMKYGYWAGSFTRTDTWPRHIHESMAREAAREIALIGGLRVEPDLGTPVRGGLPATVARRTADGWALSGSKIYATGSTGLSWFAVWAKTDEEDPRVGTFLVRAGSVGVEIRPVWNHLGMRATVSHEVVFADTPVPADHAVDIRTPAEWAAAPPDPTGALWNAVAISTIYDAVARSARDWLAGYLAQRVPGNLGKPLTSLPRVQEKFGEIQALLHVNRVLIDDAVARFEAGDTPGAVDVNIVKHVTTGNAIKAVEIGLELTGNPGLSRNNPLERHYRDVLCSRIHSPQADTILVAAGRDAFGIG